MKLSVTPIFAIAALGLLLALAQGSPLYAQNQPHATACPLEGPSIADTLKYINDAITRYPGNINGVRPTLVSGTADALTVYYDIGGGVNGRNSAHIYALACSVSWESPSTVVVSCQDKHYCFQRNFNTPSSDWMPAGVPTDSGNLIPFNCDDDSGQRLARAFAHLIALLQQQYKQSHSDPSDPFAKPPS